MSDLIQRLDPEVEGLLRELSESPESTLLRVARPSQPCRSVAALAAERRRASGRMTAEAKLLDCYRDEVAYLLRCRYYESYLAQVGLSALQPVLDAHTTGRRERGAPVVGAVAEQRLHRELAVVTENFNGSEVAEQVVEAGRLALSTPDDRLAIAAAAFRLVPTDSARMYLGYEYLAQGWIRAAVECFVRVSEGALDADVIASGRVAAGVAEMARGDHSAALGLFELAAASQTGLASAELNGLAAALQLGDTSAAHSLLSRVEEREASCAGLVPAWAKALKVSRAAGTWAPTADAKRAIRALRFPSSSTTGVILEVFAE